MRMGRVLTVLYLVPVGNGYAQDLPLQPGQRVRVTVPSADVRTQQATFQRIAGDIVVLLSASYALSDVTRLDVHRGTRRNWDRGLLLGGAVVGAVGLGLGIAWMADCEDNQSSMCPDPPSGALWLAPIGFLAGGLVGAGIGAASKRDRWEEVPLSRLRVASVTMRDGQLGLAVSVAL